MSKGTELHILFLLRLVIGGLTVEECILNDTYSSHSNAQCHLNKTITLNISSQPCIAEVLLDCDGVRSFCVLTPNNSHGK